MQFDIEKPFNGHVHLRDTDTLLPSVLRYTAAQFAEAVVMPNTNPPALLDHEAMFYESTIRKLSEAAGFRPLVTIQVIERTSPRTVYRAKSFGVFGGKAYPFGVTTNSSNGIKDYKRCYPVFRAMEEANMPLLLHAEVPRVGRWVDEKVNCLDRERLFISILEDIVRTFPGLTITVEHVSTAEMADLVASLPSNVGATITLHHLVLTLNDLLGQKLHPHHFCKPEPKLLEDRERLREYAFSGMSKFFFGTDSAPHLRNAKECADCCAGIFTEPVALPLLAELFAKNGVLARGNCFQDFVSTNGRLHYGLRGSTERLTLVKRPWIVPQELDGVVPFWAGKKIGYKVKGATWMEGE